MLGQAAAAPVLQADLEDPSAGGATGPDRLLNPATFDPDGQLAPAEQHSARGLLAPAAGVTAHLDPIKHATTPPNYLTSHAPLSSNPSRPSHTNRSRPSRAAEGQSLCWTILSSASFTRANRHTTGSQVSNAACPAWELRQAFSDPRGDAAGWGSAFRTRRTTWSAWFWSGSGRALERVLYQATITAAQPYWSAQ
jgi:hypothetical protein